MGRIELWLATMCVASALGVAGCGDSPVEGEDSGTDAAEEDASDASPMEDAAVEEDASDTDSGPGDSGTDDGSTQDFCATNPCLNGSSCANGPSTFTCTCVAGYEGTTCETNTEDCPSQNPCMNGGTCVDGIDDYTCDCATGYEGETCETNTNDCPAQNPCQNGGTCVDGLNDYTCDCATGYEGDACETNTNDCPAQNPCQNGGVCVDGVNDYACMCATGYEGPTCAVNPNDCPAQNPCENGGVCVDGVADYSCACVLGWEGPTCAVNPNDCPAQNPCANGGTCMDGVNGFSCGCAPGYEGPTCQIEIDECASNPCQNGGTCTDRVNGFSCACTGGFIGNTCTRYPTDCLEASRRNVGFTNGLYMIDPDGTGPIAAFQTYCDMTGGAWTQLLDQDTSVAPGYRAGAEWRAGVTTTAPNGGQWSALQHVGAFADGSGFYEFRMTWDDESRFVEWKQSGNPLIARGTVLDVRTVPMTQLGCGVGFGGLMAESENAALEGNPGGCWWWAVGAAIAHSGGIPAYENGGENIAQRVRLYVRRVPGMSSALCAEQNESLSMNLSCPGTTRVRAVLFGSYGTPTESCGAPGTYSTCHAAPTVPAISALCLGHTSCTIPVNNMTFTDPCGGTHKRLVTQVLCE